MYSKQLMELEDQYPELFEKYRNRYIEEGIKKNRIDTAKNLLSLGADMSLIEKATGFSEEELLSLKESL